MKRLNVKKLAAIGIGAALLGTALAPMVTAKPVLELTKSDIIDSTGTPLVDIVGGSNSAAVSDYIWAGNIAVRVAQLATMDKDVVLTPSTEVGDATPTGLSVDLTVGGTESYSSESSYTYDNNTMSSDIVNAANREFLEEVVIGKLSFLKDTTLSYRLNGNSYDQRVYEKIGLDIDAKFETENSASMGELIAYANITNDFNYEVNIVDGIPAGFASSDTNKMNIFIFGEQFKVQSVSSTSPYQVVLMKDSATQVHYEGAELPNLEGQGAYEGQTMTVTFDSITTTGVSTAPYKADFSLFDEEGNLVDIYSASVEAYLNEVFIDAEGDYPLKSVIYVESISKEATTNKGKISVTTGSNITKLKGGQEYPYDSTITTSTNDKWKTTIVTRTNTVEGAGTSISKITIGSNNNLEGRRSTASPMFAGNYAFDEANADDNEWLFLAGEEDALGYGFVKLVFDGWKGDQDETKLEIGVFEGDPNMNSYAGAIGYTDNGGTSYYGTKAVPFVVSGQIDTTSSSFDFMGRTIYYMCSLTNTDFNVTHGDTGADSLNGAYDANIYTDGTNVTMINDSGETIFVVDDEVDINGINYTLKSAGPSRPADADTGGTITLTADGYCQFSTTTFGGSSAPSTYIGTTLDNRYYYEDKNLTSLAFDAYPIPLTTDSIDDTIYYAYYASESHGLFYLLLDDTTNMSGYYGSDIQLIGTDTSHPEDLEIDYTYYIPNQIKFGGGISGKYYAAHFAVSQDADITIGTDDGDYNVFINTFTGKPFGTDIGSTDLSDYGGDVKVFAATNGLSAAYDMRTNHASYLSNEWSDFGTKVILTETGVTFTVPQNQRKLKFSIIGAGTTTEITGGEEFTGLAEGDMSKTAGGTEVTVSAINYTAGVCGVGDAVATPNMYSEIVSAGDLVYDDSYYTAGNHIIVGGYKVNNLAVGLGLSDGTTLEEALTVPGHYVAEILVDGDIIVAGYTAGDTKTAAKELIVALEALQ